MKRFLILFLLSARDFLAPVLQPHRHIRFWVAVLGALILFCIIFEFRPIDFNSPRTWFVVLGFFLMNFAPEETKWRKKSKK